MLNAPVVGFLCNCICFQTTLAFIAGTYVVVSGTQRVKAQ
jgi:hypothetical protein